MADLLHNLNHSAVELIREIHLAADVPALVQLSRQLPLTLLTLVKSHLTAYHITQIISLLSQAINQRLLQLAEQQFGPPPVAYVWLVMGSLARCEQTAFSDQDNGLLLADAYDPAQHDTYFATLAQFVCEHLDACGYRYCPGNIMASNPQWRQPLAVWQDYFRHWIATPDPVARLHSSIFFDLRCLAGEASLFHRLHDSILQQTQTNHLFLSHMAANALSHRPPLGMFRTFIQEKQADGRKGLDMKKRGVVPVIDLLRVHALAAGMTQVNTCERLEALSAQGQAISPESSAELQDAFECISLIRLQHQARQIEAGQPADNHVAPEALSGLEQRHLKDAFEVVARLQSSLAQHYQAENFR
ncbi:MAG: putative nucleotidyltransferase substrate binding domain-containing protein [Thiolinea sp.]